ILRGLSEISVTERNRHLRIRSVAGQGRTVRFVAEIGSSGAADLKKTLPRIPMMSDFAGFAEAGHKLADLPLNYEKIEAYALDEIVMGAGSQTDLYRVQKMAFGKGSRINGKVTRDRSRIIYNARITVAGIPEEAYRYMLGSRSAIEWIM